MSDTHVIENGAEVYLTDRDDNPFVADRVEITTGGWVKLINKHGYTKEFYPPEKVEFMATHTSDEEENAEWW